MGRCRAVVIGTIVYLCMTRTYEARAGSGSGPEAYDLALSFSVDLGWAAMERFDAGLLDFATELTQRNPELSIVGSPGSSWLVSLLPRVRLYLPHRTFLESGVGYLRNAGSVDVDIEGLRASYSYTNTSYEFPLLFGAALPEYHCVHLYGALGPSLLVRNRSDWSYDQGLVSDFASGRGGGIELVVGGEYYVQAKVSLHLAIRYRFSRSGALRVDGNRSPPVPDPGELDYTGISLAMGGRWQVF